MPPLIMNSRTFQVGWMVLLGINWLIEQNWSVQQICVINVEMNLI